MTRHEERCTDHAFLQIQQQLQFDVLRARHGIEQRGGRLYHLVRHSRAIRQAGRAAQEWDRPIQPYQRSSARSLRRVLRGTRKLRCERFQRPRWQGGRAQLQPRALRRGDSPPHALPSPADEKSCCSRFIGIRSGCRGKTLLDLGDVLDRRAPAGTDEQRGKLVFRAKGKLMAPHGHKSTECNRENTVVRRRQHQVIGNDDIG